MSARYGAVLDAGSLPTDGVQTVIKLGRPPPFPFTEHGPEDCKGSE